MKVVKLSNVKACSKCIYYSESDGDYGYFETYNRSRTRLNYSSGMYEKDLSTLLIEYERTKGECGHKAKFYKEKLK